MKISSVRAALARWYRLLRLREINRASAEASFYMLRSILPLLAITLAVAGRLLNSPLPSEDLMPEGPALSALPEAAAEYLTKASTFAAFLSVSTIVTLWSAAVGMRALCRAACRLAGGKEPTYTTAVFRGILGTLLFSATFALILVIFQASRPLIGFLATFFILLIFHICLSRIFLGRTPAPSPRRNALLSTTAWLGFTALFRLYLASAPRLYRLYGVIGALLLFTVYLRACLWIYLFPFVLRSPPRQAPRVPPKAPDACSRPCRKGADGTCPSKGPQRPSPS